MRSSARCNQSRLLLASIHSPNSNTQRLHRCLTSKSTRDEQEKRASVKAEKASGDVKIRRYEPSTKARRRVTNGTDSHNNFAFHPPNLKPTEADISQQAEARAPPTIRRYPVDNPKITSARKTVKHVYPRGPPYDPAETMPGIARYTLKRNTEAVTERFLGVQRVTKHEMVNKALENARAIYRQRKGQQGLDAWAKSLDSESSENADMSETDGIKRSLDKGKATISGVSESATQSGNVTAQQFDVLGAIGSKFQTAETGDEAAEDGLVDDQIPSEEAANTNRSITETTDVDWDSLPLSPLMHQGLIDARQRFHGFKRPPQEVDDYDMAKGAQFVRDYIGCMLASPIRTCRLTYARLPKDFLMTMQTIQHPETRQVWELPKRLNPQNVSLETALGASEQAEIPSDGLPSSSSVQETPAETGDTIKSATSVTSPPSDEKNSTDDVVYNNIGSYMISTQAAIQWMSKLPRKRYLRTIPLRWRQKLGNALVNQIHWRPDMPLFISSLMQRQITDQLRILKTASEEPEDKLVQPCVVMNDNSRLEISSLSKLTECAILYFGPSEQSTARSLSFTSIVEAIAKQQTAKAVVLNDMFNRSETYPLTMRIQAKDKANIIVYDMTQLLDSKFLQALRTAGYNQVAYYVKDTQESMLLRTRLWWLAHYIG